MPRLPRLDAPGAVHHVTLRGIERRAIFHDECDRHDLSQRFDRIVPEEGAACFASAFMDNHIHAVLRSGPSPISRLIARFATGYVTRFNRKYDRAGHLFQNRFHSTLVRSEAHLRVLLRYVYRNPLEAGIVSSLDELEEYPWTGHSALMGRRPPGFIAVEEVLGWFDPDPSAARRALRAWMSAPRPAARADWDLERVLLWVCEQIGIACDDVRAGRRTRPAICARALTAYLAHAELGLAGIDIGEALSLDSGSTSRAITRGRAEARRRGLELPQLED